MKDHLKKDPTNIEKMVYELALRQDHLENRINLIDTGLIALMSVLDVKPFDWYKALNDEVAIEIFNRNQE
jgi:hypothetical protein